MRRSQNLLGVLLPFALSWLALVPATAGAAVESSSLGQVTATLSYELVTRSTEGLEWHEVFNPQLTIARGGQQAFSASLASKPPCQPTETGAAGCIPLSVSELAPSSVQVADIESDGEPDVLVHLWSRGAHCCYIDQIFRWNPSTSTYTVTEQHWGDPSARVVDLAHNGQLEFLTADDRFAYAFAAYAFSGMPVQVFIFRNGRFTDVTRSYPALVAADARIQFRRYRAYIRQATCLGFLAAWAADEYLLGKHGQVLRTLQHENRVGHLREATLSGSVNRGGRFIPQLKRFLRRNGYG
jgi:hypothetical protein